MNLKLLAASAALALGLATTAAHAQVAAPTVDYSYIHGTLTVNDDGADVLDVTQGQSVTVTGTWSSTDTNDNSCPTCLIQFYVSGLPGLNAQADLFSGVILGGVTHSGSYSLTFNAPTTDGTYYIGAASSLQFHFITQSGGVGVDQSSVNYQINVAGVPEPASWALMIGGFGLAGAGLRARRRQAVAA